MAYVRDDVALKQYRALRAEVENVRICILALGFTGKNPDKLRELLEKDRQLTTSLELIKGTSPHFIE